MFANGHLSNARVLSLYSSCIIYDPKRIKRFLFGSAKAVRGSGGNKHEFGLNKMLIYSF